MVTGDQHHTAIAVAKAVGIIPKDRPILVIQAKSEKTTYSPGSEKHPGAPPEQRSPMLTAARRSFARGSSLPNTSIRADSEGQTVRDSHSHSLSGPLQAQMPELSWPLLTQSTAPVLHVPAYGDEEDDASSGSGLQRASLECELSFELGSEVRPEEFSAQQALTHLAQVIDTFYSVITFVLCCKSVQYWLLQTNAVCLAAAIMVSPHCQSSTGVSPL